MSNCKYLDEHFTVESDSCNYTEDAILADYWWVKDDLRMMYEREKELSRFIYSTGCVEWFYKRRGFIRSRLISS